MKKTIFYLFLGIIFIACKKIKLDENENKYKEKELQKMLEGTWEVVDYQVNSISFLDTFFKVNPQGNCHIYKFTQWKNSYISKTDKDLETGLFWGDCPTNKGSGYSFSPRGKGITIGVPYCFVDSIFFFGNSMSFDVKKLENNELILFSEENANYRKIYFKKL